MKPHRSWHLSLANLSCQVRFNYPPKLGSCEPLASKLTFFGGDPDPYMASSLFAKRVTGESAASARVNRESFDFAEGGKALGISKVRPGNLGRTRASQKKAPVGMGYFMVIEYHSFKMGCHCFLFFGLHH